MRDTKVLKGPGGSEVKITKGPDHLWRDEGGTVFAFPDPQLVTDPTTRAGIGWFSLPADHWMSKASAPHDFMYSSLAYQLNHSRLSADLDLLRNLKIAAGDDPEKIAAANLAFAASRIFGHIWWEGPWFEN